MLAVVQRVARAAVRVEGSQVGAIGAGLLVLLGVARGDAEAQVDYLVDKVLGLRIFPDDQGRMNRSLLEVGGGLLVVSQFTLLGDTRKGRRPNFMAAAPPETAQALYELFIERGRAAGVRVAAGVFGARMEVELVNHGPVTIIVGTEPPCGRGP